MGEELKPEQRYQRNPEMVSRRLRGEHLLVPLAASSGALDSIFTLNETAGFVWEKACEGLSAGEIAAQLSNTFRVDTPKAGEDVRRILGELAMIGAIQAVEAAG